MMKNYLLKIYILTFVLLSDFVVFAQDEEGPTEETPEGNPIDGKLLWLAIAGIAFAIYYFNSKKVKQA